MRRALALAALAAAAPPAPAQGADDEGPPPFELAREQPGDGPLSVVLRLRRAAPGLAGGAADWAAQVLAQRTAALGLHAEALAWADARPYAPRWDSVGAVPGGARAVDAVAEIARRAGGARAVMVNEAHHDASTRLLTLALLEPLYDRGYRYFAAETFAPDSVLAALPGYPTVGMGVYTDEPVFGAVVREALRLGYTLVPYEVEDADRVEGDTLTAQQRRDFTQARHLTERVFGADPSARVLVHAGYSHVNERPGRHFHPMAGYFRARTGIDPLTVDQTEVGPAGASAHEHPLWRAAVAAGLVDDGPVVLVGPDGAPLAPAGHEVYTDLQVLRPRLGGRPAEALAGALGYGAVRPFGLPDGCGPCVVEARRSDEGPDAVPVDRVTAWEGGTARLVGPTDTPLVVTVRDGRSGRVLDRRVASAHDAP